MPPQTDWRAAVPALVGVLIGAFAATFGSIYTARATKSAALAAAGIQVLETKGIDEPTREWAVRLVNDNVPPRDTLTGAARLPVVYGTGQAGEAGESVHATVTVSPARRDSIKGAHASARETSPRE